MKLGPYAVRCLVVSVVVALSLCAEAAPPQAQKQASSPAEHSAGERLTLEGVGNFGEVTPTLYRGGQPNREGYAALAKMGVNIVVDARLSGRDNERKEVEKAGMQYVAIPWHCLFPKDDTFARFLKVLLDNPGKKVFVHCRYGDDRTGMMIASYRMAMQGWTAEDARKEMEQFGFHHLVCASLGPYEKNFPEHLLKNPAFKELRAAPESHP